MDIRRIFVLMLGITAFSAAACKGKSPEADKTPPKNEAAAAPEEAAPPAAASATQAPVVKFRGPGERLVKAVGSWSLTGAPRYFGPETLYDLIDGGAEVYTAYGLKEMVTADYTAKDKPKATVTVEIYDMGSALNAFGRFSKMLQGRTDPASAAKGLPEVMSGRALLGEANASFWKGPYLVNLTLLDESAGATLESTTALSNAELPAIVSAIDEGIIGETALPKETDLFPAKNRVANSLLYEPVLFGMDGLGAGFAAAYKDDTAEWTLFITAPFADPAAAESALKNAAELFKEKNMTAAVEGVRIAGAIPGSTAPIDAKADKTLKEFQGSLRASVR